MLWLATVLWTQWLEVHSSKWNINFAQRLWKAHQASKRSHDMLTADGETWSAGSTAIRSVSEHKRLATLSEAETKGRVYTCVYCTDYGPPQPYSVVLNTRSTVSQTQECSGSNGLGSAHRRTSVFLQWDWYVDRVPVPMVPVHYQRWWRHGISHRSSTWWLQRQRCTKKWALMKASCWHQPKQKSSNSAEWCPIILPRATRPCLDTGKLYKCIYWTNTEQTSKPCAEVLEQELNCAQRRRRRRKKQQTMLMIVSDQLKGVFMLSELMIDELSRMQSGELQLQQPQ